MHQQKTYNFFKQPNIRYLIHHVTLILALLAINDMSAAKKLVRKDTTDTVREILPEVIVTARESRQATSASIIDTTAMQHLQPSSFTDLLELLPGSLSKDPSTGTPNIINLRTAANVMENDDYMSSAIGTSFVVDGVPINTNAGMQTTYDSNHSSRNTAAKGVDMRALGTDDIEKVEIIRGIASVEYGELTSGLVSIKRKSGISRLEARFKADTKSQLFYVGKGFAPTKMDWTLNFGLSFLNSYTDPCNVRDNFKRINASLRSNRRWETDVLTTSLASSLNYGATFERDNNDPDLTINNTIDYFKTANHNISFNNILTLKPQEGLFWRESSLTAGISYGHERLNQKRHVSSSRIMPMPVSLTPGSNYVSYLPMLYLAELDVKGNPLTAYLKGASSFFFSHEHYSNSIKAGIEWNMSKNYGKGHVYDLERPITASTGNRPRAFSDVPAMHQLSAYIESANSLRIGEHSLKAVIGIRETQLLHLDKRYKLSALPYLDPRLSLSWTLPRIMIADHPFIYDINGGWGLQTKMPVASFLYPDLVYTDFEQLNYYHNEERFRTMNVMTYVEDITNYDLVAARNAKWEVRLGARFMGNNLSVTYFRENMNDGFRNTGFVHDYIYNRYDASGYNPYITGEAPLIDYLPFVTENYRAVKSHITNGSTTKKEGIEFTLQSRRINVIHTRFSAIGAWFRTINCNSQPLWYKPGVIVNGKEVPYIGLYDDVDGSIYNSFNTNFVADTDLPRLGLRFSVSMQCLWFTDRQTIFRNGIPTHYIGPDDDILSPRPFTDECQNDPVLRQLIRQFNESSFVRYRIPTEASFNFKATKTFWRNRISIAIYVNRLFHIAPDYEQFGTTVRRFNSPYFGMELNLKI